ncbi:MAG: N-acetylmuramoyl-L-alanine amidase [Phage 71_18]|nr:MAG: N-acetylmuramoyl-L-alanine amidase [Phage 71_18]
MTTLVTRAQWGARPPRPGIPSLAPSFGTTVHYEGGTGLVIKNHDQCASIVRGIQAYHMDARGWLDIAYTRVACPHDHVFEGRGPHKRTAAQGTDAGNSAAYALCALLDTDDPLTPGLLDALVGGIKGLRAAGAPRGVNGHRDWHPTACPRSDLYVLIPELRRRADGTPEPTPNPPQPGPSTEAPDVILFPSFVAPLANGRRAFYELRPVDADTFVVVSFNDAPLARQDGTTPSGRPFMQQEQTTGAALGIGEHAGSAVVACANGGTYAVGHG